MYMHTWHLEGVITVPPTNRIQIIWSSATAGSTTNVIIIETAVLLLSVLMVLLIIPFMRERNS